MKSKDPEGQTNLLIAVLLSMAVLFAWQYFYAGPQMEESKRRSELDKAAHGAPTVPAKPGQPPVASPAGQVPAATAPTAVPVTRDDAIKQSARIPIKTPSLSGSVSLKGGRIDDLLLNKYTTTVDPKSPNVVLLSPAGSEHTYFAEYGWSGASGAQKLPDRESVWTMASGKELTPASPIVLTWDNGSGLRFKRTISVDADYLFKVIDAVENKTNGEVTLQPWARVFRVGNPVAYANWILHEGLVGVIGEQGLKEVKFDDAVSEGGQSFAPATGGWLGITEKYWAAALIPDQGESYTSNLTGRPAVGGVKETFQADYLRAPLTVPPNETREVTGHLYAGAKQMSLIERYEQDLQINKFDRMIDWGWFYFITRPLFKLMEYINGVVGNFGVTILILTILVRLAFFPLANKQYSSMAKMKKLQPEMEQIRARFKDDKARQQQEMMTLYQKEKVNPLAGCIPILLQIPVFFALYKVLFITIDMRHAPFFGWIKDLSAPDPTSLFNLFGLLPFTPPEFLHIGVWPLVMGITMWIQMQLNPQQPDPVQQQIFAWMPLIFTFLLATFPAGLVIYWAWSNTLSILQQTYIMKKQGTEIHLGANMKRIFAPVTARFKGSGGGT